MTLYPHTHTRTRTLTQPKPYNNTPTTHQQVADEFLDAPEFYYPHTLDFRGRAYPLHPSLHHLGE